MKENISRFKIDYSVCKNSPGGSILEKVSNFQKELQLHEENSLHIYVKSPMVSGCGREVEVVDRKTNEVKKMLSYYGIEDKYESVKSVNISLNLSSSNTNSKKS